MKLPIDKFCKAAEHAQSNFRSHSRQLEQIVAMPASLERLDGRVLLSGYTFQTIATFNVADGGAPEASLIMDRSGNLYGTTVAGGANFVGTVFEVLAGSNTVTTLASFNTTNGDAPTCRLLMDGSGNLYGTTGSGGAYGTDTGGYGTVFELAAGSHTITTLASFTGANGAGPYAGLIMDSNGNLFGTTLGGDPKGGAIGLGNVFEVVAGSHTITPLAWFNSVTGAGCYGGLLLDSKGNLYGATSSGSDIQGNERGGIFMVAAGTHAITLLATVQSAAQGGPHAGLIMDASGNLYGTTFMGGNPTGQSYGSVFELAAGSHTVTTLALLDDTTTGWGPFSDIVMDPAGNIFGTAYRGGSVDNGGTVFELPAGTSTITPIKTFVIIDHSFAQGQEPTGGVILDSSGNLYGTTTSGGAHGRGIVFKLSPSALPGVTGSTSPAVSGATITALPIGGTSPITTTTASDGTYHLQLPAGQYIVTASGTGFPTPVRHMDVTIGTDSVPLNFRASDAGTVRGFVFKDLNHNGVLDAGEPGIAGALVYVDTHHDGKRNRNEVYARTSSTGAYALRNVMPGIFRVREQLPAGYTLLAPHAGFYSVSLRTAATLSGRNFADEIVDGG